MEAVVMANPTYHVGCGIFGIYAGTLNPKGDTWRNKSEVTREALGAAAQYLMDNNKEFRFSRNGKNYALRVVERGDSDD